MKLWKKEDIPYFNSEHMNGFEPAIEPFIVENSKACVVICPGGGYTMKAMVHEGRHVAMMLNRAGVSAFVLDYRHKPYKHPAPLVDAQRAIRYARYLANEYDYDKDKIGIMGFSAGGHLAGCAGVFEDDFGVANIDDIDKESSRPDFMVLCYPVITSGEYAHKGSFYAISESKDEDEIAKLSVEKKVTPNTPPTYIMHASDDDEKGVSVLNSILMATELAKHKVPFEIHTYAHGGHGFGLADGKDIGHAVPYTDRWPETLVNWLRSMNFAD